MREGALDAVGVFEVEVEGARAAGRRGRRRRGGLHAPRRRYQDQQDWWASEGTMWWDCFPAPSEPAAGGQAYNCGHGGHQFGEHNGTNSAETPGASSLAAGCTHSRPLGIREPRASERLLHIACSPFVVALVSGTFTPHTRGSGECDPMRMMGMQPTIVLRVFVVL